MDWPFCSRSCACSYRNWKSPPTPPPLRPQSGKDNPNWKGGRTYLKNGYVMIRAPQDHPRRGRGGYIFEHILVIEEKLGRYLTVGETIHHKNGVKGDKRIENLELWVKNHPGGTRVSDLVEWAKYILEKYVS